MDNPCHDLSVHSVAQLAVAAVLGFRHEDSLGDWEDTRSSPLHPLEAMRGVGRQCILRHAQA